MPNLLDMGDDLASHDRLLIGCRNAAAPGQVERVEQLAENVDLVLGRCGIADAHRARVAVARQRLDLPFREVPRAVDPIHDPQLLRRPGDRAQQPVPPAGRLGVEPGIQQCAQA